MRLFLCKIRKIEAGAREEILWLSNIHPISLQIKRMQLSICGHLWKDFLFDRGGSKRDAIKDGSVENVNAGIDTIGNKFNRFLHETFNLGRVGFHHHNTIFRGFFDFGNNDCTFFAMSFVELR